MRAGDGAVVDSCSLRLGAVLFAHTKFVGPYVSDWHATMLVATGCPLPTTFFVTGVRSVGLIDNAVQGQGHSQL